MIPQDDASPFVSLVERSGPSTISGYVYHREDPTLRPVVELVIDGIPVALGRAEVYGPDLDRGGIGDGRYGFSFVLSPDVVAGGEWAVVLLANRGETLAPAIDLRAPKSGAQRAGRGPGAVEWSGGLCLTGWLAPAADPADARVRAVIDGETVVEGIADRWHLRSPGGEEVDPAFQIHLPERFADGLTKRVVVTDGAGMPLGGSPIALVACPDPLELMAAEAFGPDVGAMAIRARLFDTLSPATAPLYDVAQWARRYPLPAPDTSVCRFAVAILGDGNAAAGLTRGSLDGARGLVTATALPSPDGIGFERGDLLAFLDGEAAKCDALLLASAGTRFMPMAAQRLAATLHRDQGARLVYGDYIIERDGEGAVFAHPAFDYERWLEQGYGALLFAIRPSDAAETLRAGASDLYHVALSVIADPVAASRSVVHLPGFAATLPPPDLDAATRRLAEAARVHLRGRAVAAAIRPNLGHDLPAIEISREAHPRPPSLIMTVRGRYEGLPGRLETLRGAITRAGCELILLDADHPDEQTRANHAAWRRDGVVVLVRPDLWSPAARLNHAARVARGDSFCFLTSQFVARDDAWLGEMLGRLSEPSTVAVGGLLRGPGGGIHHAGFVLGPGFAAGGALTDHRPDEPGPGDQLLVAREVSAVSEGCMLVRRDTFDAIGGFDDLRFPHYFPAIDLCLRLGARGGRIVLTPHLDVTQASSVSAPMWGGALDGQRDREVSALRHRWGEALMNDPSYSPLLGLSGRPFASLACPPRPLHPRRRQIPHSCVFPATA